MPPLRNQAHKPLFILPRRLLHSAALQKLVPAIIHRLNARTVHKVPSPLPPLLGDARELDRQLREHRNNTAGFHFRCRGASLAACLRAVLPLGVEELGGIDGCPEGVGSDKRALVLEIWIS